MNQTQHTPYAEVKTKIVNSTCMRPCTYGHPQRKGQSQYNQSPTTDAIKLKIGHSLSTFKSKEKTEAGIHINPINTED
jgi:hypothetical protein